MSTITGPERLVLVALPGNKKLTASLAGALDAAQHELEYRRFPDGESYLRLEGDVADSQVILVATLDRPDDKIPALLFAADLVRDLGARRVGLICPYLPYMRQDCRFRPGEALTSKTFARWVSTHFDWLVTVDPHLHRYAGLEEIFSLASSVVPAAPALADWIAAHVDRPVLIGPDSESEQWVSAVAASHDLPWRVLSKHRHGDRRVSMQLPDLTGLEARTPVLVDDIISSGTTMAEAASHLMGSGFQAPVAVGVHGLFGDRSRATLRNAGIRKVVCTNTVAVPEAGIDISPLLADAIGRLV